MSQATVPLPPPRRIDSYVRQLLDKKPSHAGHLLIVDDSITTIEYVKRVLAGKSYRISSAGHGEEAIKLALASEDKPDLMLLDIMMPDMDGYEVCRRLQREGGGLKVPVIFMSTLAESFDKVRAFELGAVDYVTKPPSPEELRARVATHMMTSRLLRQLYCQAVELKKSELRYRELFESSNDAILVNEVDEHGNVLEFTDVNAVACRWLGYDRQQLLEMTFRDIMPPWSEGQLAALFRRVVAREHDVFEHTIYTKRSELIPVEISARVFERQGERRIISLIRDITARKQAEADLRKAKSYIASIINSMPSMLVSVDPDGVVTLWNEQAERVTGLTASQALGRTLNSVVPHLTVTMDQIGDAIRSNRKLSETKKAYRRKGETRYEDVTIYPIVAGGVDGAVIRIDDVTDEVRVAEMLVQSEKMLSVGGLAAGMAHEVNNPLAGMIQTADVMCTRLTDLDLPANQRAAAEAGTTMESIRSFMEARGIVRMLDRIQQSGARAAEIVSNMLSFARRSDGSSSSRDLAALLDRAVDLAGSDYDLKRYDFRQIEIVREYEAGMPPIFGENSKLQQVFLNILRNGAEAMHETTNDGGGRQPRFVLRLQHDHQARRARIEIEDNGPGMDEATRKRVFEPFFTTKPVGAGTGLGLSVSYFIVAESFKGEMTVESEAGSGSKFIISLPLNIGQAADENGYRCVPPDATRRRRRRGASDGTARRSGERSRGRSDHRPQ